MIRSLHTSPSDAASGRRSACRATRRLRWTLRVDDRRGGALDGGPGEIDVASVVLVELDDEDPAVALGAQQALLDQALHRLADRAATDLELAGQLHLGQLRIAGRTSPSRISARNRSAIRAGVLCNCSGSSVRAGGRRLGQVILSTATSNGRETAYNATTIVAARGPGADRRQVRTPHRRARHPQHQRPRRAATARCGCPATSRSRTARCCWRRSRRGTSTIPGLSHGTDVRQLAGRGAALGAADITRSSDGTVRHHRRRAARERPSPSTSATPGPASDCSPGLAAGLPS